MKDYYKQFIPSKRNIFGIKSFVLCVCKMGYTQDFIIYMGSRTSIESQHNDIRKSKSVVMSFLEQYLDTVHAFYVVKIIGIQVPSCLIYCIKMIQMRVVP